MNKILIGIAALMVTFPSIAEDNPLDYNAMWKKNGVAEVLGNDVYDEQGTASLPAMQIPISDALDKKSKVAVLHAKGLKSTMDSLWGDCPIKLRNAKPYELASIRNCRTKAFRKTDRYKNVMARYDVKIKEKTIGGIATDIYTPSAGISQKQRNRVLIHAHGGAHYLGSRWVGYVSATPVAAEAGIKVVSVDYRQWPEAHHPAALEDIATVYKELLKEYRPENIGIYGCSAGGNVAGQSVPMIAQRGLPKPGAIGVFGANIGLWGSSDSYFYGLALNGIAPPTPAQQEYEAERMKKNGGVLENFIIDYYEGANINDPLISPLRHPDVLANYPPTLLATGFRDPATSALAYAHNEFAKVGVESELRLWDGLGHCFFVDTEIPESREAIKVIAQFFDKHLGKKSK